MEMLKEGNYNTRQAANMLGVKTRTIRDWIRQGKIRGVKYEGMSSGWFVPKSEMSRILDAVTMETGKNADKD